MTIKVLARGVGCGTGTAGFEYEPGYVFVEDAACREYDWLVVYDELPSRDVGTFRNGAEPLACPRENTILATAEPVSIKNYTKSYAGQFGHLLTNRPQSAEDHPGWHLGSGYYRWYIGRRHSECAEYVLPPKTKTISVACSSKRMRHTRHNDRFRLVEELAKSVPGLDWFGRGVRGFGKKYEVMDPYKYHVAIENHIAPHHWSEKLSDSILSECLTFYAGDPLIGEILPKEAIIPIPIDDPKLAAEIVNAAIAGNEWEKRRDAILEAKRLILEKYNFYAQVIEVIEAAGGGVRCSAEAGERIWSRHKLRLRSPRAAVESICGFMAHTLRQIRSI